MIIYGERVRQARELRGFTQIELAGRLHINQSSIAYIENGRLLPSDDLVSAIALQTGFPPSFFRQAPTGEFPLGSLLFRSRASLTSREETRVRRYAQTAHELLCTLMERVRPRVVRLPSLNDDGTEAAARVTRAALGLSPDTPITNAITVVEQAGVLVIALPIVTKEIDAFSLWTGSNTQRPVIVTCSGWPGDRLRFSIAHELGHLVMHQAAKGSLAGVEREANAFAGELLLPAMAMIQELIPPITLSSLAPLKLRWGVSIQAIIMRAHHLGIISERQKRYLFQQLSARGWKTKEPANLDIPTEKPRALRQLVEMFYGSPTDYERLATEVHLPSQLVRELAAAPLDASECLQRNMTNGSGASNIVRFP